MKMIFRYISKYKWKMLLGMFLKLAATAAELLLPYILEYLLDEIVPTKNMTAVVLTGCLMIVCAFVTWILNLCANRSAIYNAHNISYDIRRDLFDKTINLSGTQFERFGLPSLTSRMTSDSYNVQNFTRALQTICVRAPFMMAGGIVVTVIMNVKLSLILLALVPVLLLVVFTISKKGIPMYKNVQKKLDRVVTVMRENILGIKVIKALSKTEYEKDRFRNANDDLAESDIKTGTYMAVPGPFMQLCLNIGLSLVVLLGAYLVNSGEMKTGVILAFLTYFNLILQSVMAINRMFIMGSKASASADRIDEVLKTENDMKIIQGEDTPDSGNDVMISFENVDFSYENQVGKALENINFTVKKGESLGIIGATGCGKTTVLNLMMRFYDVSSGKISIDGKNVRSYEKDELRKKFGVVFQNDIVFNDTIRNNIDFGRNLPEEQIIAGAEDGMASEFIRDREEGMDHMVDIKGANLSGGQKQRLMVSRALAGNPEIIVLDDSSSALDYKTDALLRRAVKEHHSGSTVITVAQRVSSVMGMTNIMVLDKGHIVGYGSHEHLMKSCAIYRETFGIQMSNEILR